MKTREQLMQDILDIKSNNILLELSTGVGKTRLAIQKIASYKYENPKILVVIHRLVHEKNWVDEFIKWNYTKLLDNVVFTTYNSLHKHIDNWDIIIFDEAHALSERCRTILKSYKWKHSLLLSATVPKKLKDAFTITFPRIFIYSLGIREAIDNDILPNPKVILLPQFLNSTNPKESFTINKTSSLNDKTLVVSYSEYKKYMYLDSYTIIVKCTEEQYYNYLCEKIDKAKYIYYKKSTKYNKNVWLSLCNQRLKFLSDIKVRYTKKLLKMLDKERTLTFCNSIEQTELLGTYCINSKNKDSKQILQDFNDGKIKHITSCNMLNESINLANCRIGIFNNCNSADIIVSQRNGRLLRHKNPIILVPYYKYTREEELISKFKDTYADYEEYYDIKKIKKLL
jgi:superfamily II DNA or RNA helicase